LAWCRPIPSPPHPRQLQRPSQDWNRQIVRTITAENRSPHPMLVPWKEVIQPQVPLRLPCYDFTPVADPTVVTCLLAVSAAT